MSVWLTIILYWLLIDVCIVMMVWGTGDNKVVTEDEYAEYIKFLNKYKLSSEV